MVQGRWIREAGGTRRGIACLLCVCALLAAGCAPEERGKEQALLAAPAGLVVARDGSMLVSEWGGGRVVRLGAEGRREALLEGVDRPAGLAVGPDGAVVVCLLGEGRVVALDPAAPCVPPRVLLDGLRGPAGLAFDALGGLFVAERDAGRILRLAPDGTLAVVREGLVRPVGVLPAPWGGTLVTEYGGRLLHVAGDRTLRRLAPSLRCPSFGIVADARGRVFAVDHVAGEVRQILPDGATRTVRGGLRGPTALAVGPHGALYAGTWGDGAVWRMDISGPGG